MAWMLKTILIMVSHSRYTSTTRTALSLVYMQIRMFTVFFIDVLSRQVKRLDVMTGNIFIVAGSGSTGPSDGKDSDISFTQLHGIWHEGQVTYVTDAASGSVRMITPLAGTVKFLRHLTYFMIHLVCF